MHAVFDVFVDNEEIDTVFHSPASTSAAEVRRSLIEHDGYYPLIVVKRRTKTGEYDDVAGEES